MTVLYPKPFKNEVCYKGTVLYQFSCLAFLLDIRIKKSGILLDCACPNIQNYAIILCISFLYPATKVWRGIMLYPSVSVRLSVRPSVLTISDR